MLTDPLHNLIAQFRFAAPKSLQVLNQDLDDVGLVLPGFATCMRCQEEVGQRPQWRILLWRFRIRDVKRGTGKLWKTP